MIRRRNREPREETAAELAQPAQQQRNGRTILVFFLLILWVNLLLQAGQFIVGVVFGSLEMAEVGPDGLTDWITLLSQLVVAGMAFLALLIHKRWFRPEFTGCLTSKNFLAGLAFMAADVVYIVGSLFTEPISWTGFNINNLTLALAAGVTEEVAFRAVPGSYLMRQWREEKNIPAVVLLTAAVFGLGHVTNLFFGADTGATAVQVISAFGIGVLYGAAFLRTGNIWPCMLGHFLHDALALLATDSIQDGVMVSSLEPGDVVVSLLISGIFIALGFWVIRPAKRRSILALWDEKWSREAPAPDAVS